MCIFWFECHIEWIPETATQKVSQQCSVTPDQSAQAKVMPQSHSAPSSQQLAEQPFPAQQPFNAQQPWHARAQGITGGWRSEAQNTHCCLLYRIPMTIRKHSYFRQPSPLQPITPNPTNHHPHLTSKNKKTCLVLQSSLIENSPNTSFQSLIVMLSRHTLQWANSACTMQAEFLAASNA